MTIEVEGPDGAVVQFPDGTAHATIQAAMARHYGGQAKPAAAGPVPQRAQPAPAVPQKPAGKRSLLDDISGGAETLIRSIPFADEARDKITSGIRTSAELFMPSALAKAARPGETADRTLRRVRGEHFDEAQAQSKAWADAFEAAHPNIGNLLKGVGLAGQAVIPLGDVVPAAGVVSGAAADVRGLIGYAYRLATRKAANPAVLGEVSAAAGGRGLLGAGDWLAARKAAKPAVLGAMFGAGNGLAGEGTAQERLHDANVDGAAGFAMGAAIPPVVGVGVGAVNGLRRLLGPSEGRAAARAGRVLAGRVPQIGEPAAAAPQAGELPFEAMGGGGRSLAKAVAAVPGPGRDIAEDVLRTQRAGAEGRMLGALRRDLGDDGSNFHPTLEAMDKLRLEQADPLYAEAHAKGPMYSVKLQDLERRGSVQDARKAAAWLAREEGHDPMGLGLGKVENADAWTSEYPQPAAPPEPGVGFAGKTRGPAKAPPRGPRLLKFLADNGGVSDVTGDITNMGGDRWHEGKAHQRRLVAEQPHGQGTFAGAPGRPQGLDPDVAAYKAWEAGYLPEFHERPTTNELYKVIDEELRGQPRYARSADPAAQSRFEAKNAAEERDYYGGDPADLPHPEDYVGRPAPYDEPAHEYQPTARTWDYIKRALDDQLAPYREGKFAWDEKGRAIQRTLSSLLEELDTLNPKYAEARAAYSGPSKIMDAMQYGRKLIRGRKDAELVDQVMENLSRNEKDGLAIGLAREISDEFRSNNPATFAKRLRRDGVLRDRIKAGFGNEKLYNQFMGDVMAEAHRQDVYDGILSGSRTTPLREDIDAANEAGRGMGDKVASVAEKRLGGQSFVRQAVEAAASMAAKARSPALSDPAVSQILAEVLYKGRDPQEVLSQAIATKVVTPEQAQQIMAMAARAGGSSMGVPQR